MKPRGLLLIPALLFLGILFFYPWARILSMTMDLSALRSSDVALAASVLRFTSFQAALSTLLTLLLGLPAALLFARFEFPGRSLLRALTTVPFLLPTVVVAAGFNALLGPRGWLNLTLMQAFSLATAPVPFRSPRSYWRMSSITPRSSSAWSATPWNASIQNWQARHGRSARMARAHGGM
jgi:thiamine transport system permease protein